MTLIDPETINSALLPALLERDTDRIFEFMTEHVVDYQSMAQMFETLPRLVSTLIERFPDGPKPARDEFWALEMLPGASQVKRMNGQMIVAALNGDDARVTDLIKSVLTWPQDAVERLMADLFVSFIQIVDAWPKSNDSASA